MSEGFVEIMTFPWSLSQAQMAKIQLEAYGIVVELQDELMIGTGKVKLLVKREDADQAKEILTSHLEMENPYKAPESEGSAETVSDRRRNDAKARSLLSRLRAIQKPFIWVVLGANFLWIFVRLVFTLSSLYVSVPVAIVAAYLIRKKLLAKKSVNTQQSSNPQI